MSERYEIYAVLGSDACAETLREAAEKAVSMFNEEWFSPVPLVFLRDSRTGILMALDHESALMYAGPVPEPQSLKVDR